MSGGFFRGTSADQDTRFSNKQAKLLKSQKFAPELDHLVDMTKVKMEVMKPWIGRRVTELLGFEDEVLINFIYTLLEEKVVNGKEVQIQLTGFMEKNTGKFMKELWTLLLSAQQTVSGVPQPLLDAKAEELQKKEAYEQNIVSNIEKRKDDENKELTQRSKRMDGVKSTNFDMELGPNVSLQKDIRGRTNNDKVINDRNGNRERGRSPLSPVSNERMQKSSRGLQSFRRRSGSHSRGFSGDRRSSRSLSISPVRRRRSRTPPSRHRYSVSPVRRNSNKISVSPVRRRTYSRRRSSLSGSRSPSPGSRRISSYNRRSPPRRNGRSPLTRRQGTGSPGKLGRSPSPRRHDRSSPGKHRRSPLPSRHWRLQSDRNRESPSPSWHPNSPSPNRRPRSPASGKQQESPSGRHYRSRSSRQVRPGTPVRCGRSPQLARRHVRSPSPSHVYRRSPSSEVDRSYSPSHTTRRVVESSASRKGHRSQESASSSSPSPRRSFSPSSEKYQGEYKKSTLQQKDLKIRRDPSERIIRASPQVDQHSKSPKSPNAVGVRDLSQNRRSLSMHASKGQERFVDGGSLSLQRDRELTDQHSSPETSEAEETAYAKNESSYSRSSQKVSDLSPDKSKMRNANDPSDHGGKGQEKVGRGISSGFDEHKYRKKDHSLQVEEKPPNSSSTKLELSVEDTHKNSGAINLSSDDSGRKNNGTKEKKTKRSHRRDLESDDEESSGSEIEDRKQAKRRRKEEKRLRKQERRRRRKEKSRRKEERRSEKQKLKDLSCDSFSDDGRLRKLESYRSGSEEAHDDQKKLEIELRNKALESYKAKKGINS